MNSAENLTLHCESNYGVAIQAREISNANMATLLCRHEKERIGFAQLRWGPAPTCAAGTKPGEIQRFYVSGPWHGKGVAQGLMRASIEELEQRDTDVAWLGVWEQNRKAVSFYEKFGFAEVGDHVFLLGNDSQRDIIMCRSLRASPSAEG